MQVLVPAGFLLLSQLLLPVFPSLNLALGTHRGRQPPTSSPETFISMQISSGRVSGLLMASHFVSAATKVWGSPSPSLVVRSMQPNPWTQSHPPGARAPWALTRTQPTRVRGFGGQEHRHGTEYPSSSLHGWPSLPLPVCVHRPPSTHEQLLSFPDYLSGCVRRL